MIEVYIGLISNRIWMYEFNVVCNLKAIQKNDKINIFVKYLTKERME